MVKSSCGPGGVGIDAVGEEEAHEVGVGDFIPENAGVRAPAVRHEEGELGDRLG